MDEIKIGDEITVNCVKRTGTGKCDHYGIEPQKFKVLEVYEHIVLCQNVKTGVKESFTWWGLKRSIVKG